ncbi:MAG: DUF4097 domain-containing protein [bacterium]|nr:DUF4097 domain-containing protein [bacterium]
MTKQFIYASLVFAGLFATTPSLAGEATTTTEREVSAAGIRRLQIDNRNGDIEILTTTDGKIELHAITKISGFSDRECEQLANESSIDMKRSGITLEIQSSRWRSDSYERSITYTLLVPPELDITAETESGNIACRDLDGDIDLASTSGDLEILNCTGKLNGSTTDGDITVESSSREAYFESVSGDCDLFVALPSNGRMRVNTTNGAVKIHLAGDVNATISARTANGIISCGSFAEAISINRNRTYASGRLGYGEGAVIVETVNGSISFDTFHPQPVAQAAVSSEPTVIYKTTPVIVEHRYINSYGDPCSPRFRHVWRPWRTVHIPPLRIVFGPRHHDRHDDHGWHRDRDHRDRDRDGFRDHNRKPRHRR